MAVGSGYGDRVTAIEVRELDSGDVTMLRRWWEVGYAATRERPVDFWTPWVQAEPLWTLPPVDREVHTFGAFDAEEMVGAARLMMPEKDNTHLAFLELYVRPERRREGIGRATLELVEAVAADRGRTTVLGSAVERPGAAGAASRFAAATGYPRVSREEIKVVDLAATEADWPALAEEVADATLGYDLLWWADAVPAEHLDDMLVLLTRFLDEIPLEGMDLKAQQWDESRLRRIEERRLKSGFHELVVAVRAPGGRLVGYSNVIRGTSTPHWCGIDGTLVLPEHRGHRLGLALKVRLHQLVREQYLDCRFVMTGNAGVNAHMNAVNERLGYTVVEEEHGVQKVLPA